MARRRKTIGAPPGSLVYTGEVNKGVEFTLIDYAPEGVVEKRNASIDECMKCLRQDSVTWINVQGLNDLDAIEEIGNHFNLNFLVLEDILNINQRPKAEDYKDYLFIVLKIFHKIENQPVESDQFSLVLGNNFVLTFLEEGKDFLEPVRIRIRKDRSRIRLKGADYLAYTFIDCVVDQGFSILEKLDDELEQFENELCSNPTQDTLARLQKYRHEIALLRKSVWPMREVVSSLERKDFNLIKDDTRVFLHDVHDHTIQMVETIEGLRDILSGMLDIYLSNISLKMNEIMKVLTIVSTIFVPMTFIASVFGMNFQDHPLFKYEYSFYISLGLMAFAALSMFALIAKKNWLIGSLQRPKETLYQETEEPPPPDKAYGPT